MFSFANMFHFLADKFPGLGGGRFSLCFIFSCSFERFFFWHTNPFLSTVELLRTGAT
jgi:hypothetical protein